MDNEKYLRYKVLKAEADVYIEKNAELYSYYQSMSPAILNHAEGVTKIALIMGIELGFNYDELIKLGVAGLLHDIGKIFISSTILYKNGNLTDEEFEIMKEHPQLGAKLISRLGIDPEIVEAVQNHHEREDGSGYPNRLTKTDLSGFTQIITIADIFDALRHKRCYKEALSGKEAIEELRDTVGLNIEYVEVLAELVHKLRL